MNLREEILKEHSKEQCRKIVAWIGSSQKRFDELFYLFLHDEYRVVQRAAWPMSYSAIAHPPLIEKNFPALIKKLQQPGNHDAVKRNSVRLLQDIDIPEKWQGDIMNICFDYLGSPTEAIAIKAFSMTVLGNLAKAYPEIIPELKLVIEDQLHGQSPAFKNRAKQVFKKLNIKS